MWRRLGFSLCLAAMSVVVLGTRVYWSFERVRVQVVANAAQVAEDSSTVIRLPDRVARLSGQAVAIILRVRGTSEPITVNVALDGRTLPDFLVPADREVRIDTSIDSMPAQAREITFTAPRPGWRITYLEVANVHGHSDGIIGFVVVPGSRSVEPILPPWVSLLLLVMLAALRPRPSWPQGRGRIPYRIAAGAVLLLFGVALLANVFTRFAIVLAFPTFLMCAAVLYAEPISRGVRYFWGRGLLDRGGSPAVGSMPHWREVLLAGAGLVVVVAVLLHAQVRAPYSVPDLGDPLFSMWRIAWVLHQLGADPGHLFDANIFHPARGTLTYSDSIILPAITALPLLRAGVHPVLAYNLLLLSGFVLSGLATYVFGRSLGFGVVGAWTSAVIFAVLPYRLDHYSHLELQMAQWMPLALLGVHRFMLAGGRRYLALTAVAVAAQWYSSMYYALFLSVFVAVFALVLAVLSRDWRRLAQVAGAVLLGACLALPLAAAYAGSQKARGERPLEAIHELSATPADYLQPTDRSALYAGMNPQPAYGERALFPGVAPIALAVAGAWPPLSPTRLALLLSGIVAFDGSLGLNGYSYPLLYEFLFPFRSIRVPARFAMLVGLTLALFSGAALARLRMGPRRFSTPLAGAVVTALLLIDAWPTLRLVPVWRAPPPIYGALGASSGAVLMEYPINPDPAAFGENLPYMYFSTWHLTPTVNGYSGFLTQGYDALARAMRGFPGGDTVPYLTRMGVTHISVICALDGRFGDLGVPIMDRSKCDKTISHLDADPRLLQVVRSEWQGAPALLYQIRK